MITIRNLAKSYGGTPVLERVNLDIAAGSFVTLVGASGCGKTTLLRMLLGQEQPDSGEILLDGSPLPREPTPDRGIVFQRYSVFPHLTVEGNLMLPAGIATAPLTARAIGVHREKAIARSVMLMRRTGLMAARARYPAQLSGGMQQRLALAQALMLEPRVLLLDEPLGALDPGVRADMHDLLQEFWREFGMTVLMVTHDLSEAFKLGTRLVVLDKIRHDAQAPSAYGATVTYDIRIDRNRHKVPSPGDDDPAYAEIEQSTHHSHRMKEQEVSPC